MKLALLSTTLARKLILIIGFDYRNFNVCKRFQVINEALVNPESIYTTNPLYHCPN